MVPYKAITIGPITVQIKIEEEKNLQSSDTKKRINEEKNDKKLKYNKI